MCIFKHAIYLAATLCITSTQLVHADSHTLWYEQPAEDWQLHALPIGNGKLGAMVFGKVERERLMLNEDSLWIGDEEDTGSYQALGDLFIQLHPAPAKVTPSSPSHNNDGGGEQITAAFDGDAGSKWCFEHGNKDIIAQLASPNSEPLTSYSITSANDVPERDPHSWKLEGSQDGTKWTTLDTKTAQEPWPKRHQKKTFQVKNSNAYAHYRFVFEHSKKVAHFQIAELATNLADSPSSAKNYTRKLCLDEAVHHTAYTYDNVDFKREAFSSVSAGVMALHFTASTSGAHSGVIEFADKHEAKITGSGDTLIAAGNLQGYRYNQQKRSDKPTYKLALDFETQIKVIHQGGAVKFHKGKLHVKNCDSFTILLAAGTNYLNQHTKEWKGPHPHKKLTQQLASASKKGFSQLKKEHLAEHRALYRRFEVKLPANENSKLPTDKRLHAYQKNRGDKGLETLQLHYARYLMLSCSRPGSLPANLQGMWNPSNNPPWRCDYHSDVNVQMNYWFVDQTNISECFQPYADYQSSVREVRITKTKKKYGTRGWATRSENGIFGGSSYLWVPGDAAWLAQNLWDHYAYTKDQIYLKEQLYPILKELCEFWEDFAVELPDGRLVSPPSVSPEHGPKVAGNSYEDQLMYDLFTNYIEASEALDVDADFRKKITNMRSRLLGPQIGKWGQLQEWMEDRDDPKNKHRHLSHLISVYPGRQIAPATTPQLAKAAAVSLDARGDSGTGWSIGWKINLWARLLDGDRAYRILQNSLNSTTTTKIVMNYGGGTYDNLLMAHPPFQIEANFGYASGFCEMLMQSHLDEIHLLPSLPAAWPSGSIKGLKARGNHRIDLVWENNKLTTATIRSPKGCTPKIRIGSAKETISPKDDKRITFKTL